MPDLAFDIVDARPNRTACAHDAVAARLRRRRATDHTMVLRSQVQIGPAPLVQRDREGSAGPDLSGSRSGGATRCGRSPGPRAPRWCRASRLHRGRTSGAVHLRLRRRRRQVHARIVRRSDPVVVPVQRHGDLAWCHRVLVTQIRWRKESIFPFPVATWQQLMAVYFPGSAGSGCARTRSNCSPSGGWRVGSRAGTRCWLADGALFVTYPDDTSAGAVDRRRRSVEGYVLYPIGHPPPRTGFASAGHRRAVEAAQHDDVDPGRARSQRRRRRRLAVLRRRDDGLGRGDGARNRCSRRTGQWCR